MVEPQPSKLAMRVRSPSPAPVGLIPVEGTTLSYQNGRELPGGSHAVSVLTGVSAPALRAHARRRAHFVTG